MAHLASACRRDQRWYATVHVSVYLRHPTEFIEQILPGGDEGVKAPRLRVGRGQYLAIELAQQYYAAASSRWQADVPACRWPTTSH